MKSMNKLYIKNELPEIISIIYSYIEPIYTCRLIKRPNPAANLACTAKHFNQIRHSYSPEIYKDKCKIVKKIKVLCHTHCKAYPIYALIHQQSGIDYLDLHIQRQVTVGFFEEQNTGNYMHFKNKFLARFAPYLINTIKFIRPCCSGSGWYWRWRHQTQTKSDPESSEEEEETNSFTHGSHSYFFD